MSLPQQSRLGNPPPTEIESNPQPTGAEVARFTRDDIAAAHLVLASIRGGRVDRESYKDMPTHLHELVKFMAESVGVEPPAKRQLLDGFLASETDQGHGDEVAIIREAMEAAEAGFQPEDVKPGPGQAERVGAGISGRKQKAEKREPAPDAFANADAFDGDAPISLAFIELDLHEIIESPMPYLTNGRLFVDPPSGHEPVWLENPSSLFAFVAARAKGGLYWKAGTEYPTKEMLFEHLKQVAPRRVAVEKYPHFPSLPGHHYLHPPLPKPSGKLDELIDSFNPATPADRALAKAFIVTSFWGGPPGSRPGFLVTGPDLDPKNGVGVGKSTLTEKVAELSGGYIEISGRDDFGEVKTRALSPAARHKRMFRIDNLKSSKFSWGELEGQVTATEISGRMLYKGDGTRPNTLTLALTLNGASLSRDMADRCVIIKLNRPKYRASWDTEVAALIENHRWDIIADVGEILGRDVAPIEAKTRFAVWEQEVLARVGHLDECQNLILERQGSVNDDATEQVAVADFFRDKIRQYGHNPEADCVAIPALTAAEWLSDASRKHYSTPQACSHLNTLAIPELTRTRTNASREWVWRGPGASQGSRPGDLVKAF